MKSVIVEMVKNKIAEDLNDPEFWRNELGIEMADYLVGLRKHGARIDMTFTITKLLDDEGYSFPPGFEYGIRGGEPEQICSTVDLAPEIF